MTQYAESAITISAPPERVWQTWVEEINETMDLALPMAEAYETIGGLIIDRLGQTEAGIGHSELIC